MNENPKITKVLKPAGESASFGTGWHTDNSFFEEPSMGSVLYGKTIPPFGGDTLFANQYLAYEALSDTMKEMLDGLSACTRPRKPIRWKAHKQIRQENRHHL